MRFSSPTREFTKPIYSETEGRVFNSTREMDDHAKENGLYIKETPSRKLQVKSRVRVIDGTLHDYNFKTGGWEPRDKEKKDEE